MREDFLEEVTWSLLSRDRKDNLGISQRRKKLGQVWQLDIALVPNVTGCG